MNKIKNLIFYILLVIIFTLISCDERTYSDNYSSIRKRLITDLYYNSWNYDNDEGLIQISPDDLQTRDAFYYEKLDSNGNRIIKGFYYKGLKQDFWTYYNTKGDISKIEFFDNGEITQTINYD